jgi:hypothetical protein
MADEAIADQLKALADDYRRRGHGVAHRFRPGRRPSS